MMAGHGLMWSNIYQPEKPKVKRRVDWKRMGALFAPYWREQATVLACIVAVSALGLVPGFIIAHIIDAVIPHHNLDRARDRRWSHPLFRATRCGHRRAARLSELGRRRRHHARHPHEPCRASPSHALALLHRHQDRRNHESRQQRRRQRRQRRNRNANFDRDECRRDRNDHRRDVRLELAARAHFGRDRSADGLSVGAGWTPDVCDPQEDAREA